MDGILDMALLRSCLRFFYLQRCGCALSAEDAGAFAHAACHTRPARIYGTQMRIDVSGGWHDAGDYGRYTVPGVKATADLLLAYLAAPSLFDTLEFLPRPAPDTSMRQGRSALPDILSEARYELAFLQKLQREDGSVYHKVSCAHFCGFVMPDQEKEELLVSPVSTAATGDFAGVMAIASVAYEAFDPAYAEQCLNAACRAYAFLRMHEPLPFHNPEGVDTGQYDDDVDTDERFFAAAWLYGATGDPQYADDAAALLSAGFPIDLGWADMGGYGCLACLYAPKGTQSALDQQTRSMLIARADVLLTNAQTDPNGISLGGVFRWGSNMYLLNNAVLLCYAYQLNGKTAYLRGAERHLAYLLAENPLNMCYVTGMTPRSPKRPHHRPSESAGYAMPGMVVGGPNGDLEDDCARIVLQGRPPVECYTDAVESYSTNEVTVYWNSPLVLLIALLHGE